MEVSQKSGYLLGVPMIRIIMLGGPCSGPPISGNLPYTGIYKDVCMKGLTQGLILIHGIVRILGKTLT